MAIHLEEMSIGLFPCLLCISIFLSCVSAAIITRETPLSVGQALSSPGGTYELGFFSPNNSQSQYVGIWFKKITPRVVVWVANREKPITSPVANLTISRNGSFVLLDSGNNLVWSARKSPTATKCHAELLDTGNLVIVDDVSGKHLWQSLENPGDTMLPDSSLMYNLSTGEKRVLTSWRSHTDPSPGNFVLQLTPQVPPQIVTMRGSTLYKRSGPWSKTGFTGVPLMDESYSSPFSLSQDVVHGTGHFSYLRRNSVLTRVIITSEGYLKTFRYNGTGWVLDFMTPANSCDLYGACGPFGLCVVSNPTKCNCMKGFVPRYKEEWKRGNMTSGCVRRTELSCQGNSSSKTQGKDTDVFYRLANVKPPDLYELLSFVDSDGCQQACLSNCSCTAFSYITGIGCLIWSQELMDTVKYSIGGEFLSIRLASSELVGSRRTKIIAGSISLSIFLILAFASYKFWRYRAKQNESWKNGLEPQEISGLTFFAMNTIRTATNNFSLLNKLGQGGFGPVYKGILSDGKEVAVKRLSSSSGQGTEEFMNEIKLISKLQHRNLVRLLGCCIDGEEKLLIYEFLANKSLDNFLFDLTLKLQIDWPKRFNIIQGVARGLLYLHRDSCLRIIHRDLKVSNILLDDKMNPKISDFGLARMFQGTQHQGNTHKVVGTLGYMSPEYAWTGMFSEKSDIYAFGVLQLEIISGKKISSFKCEAEGKTLLEYAWECWVETGGVDLLDQDISSSCSPVEVARCVQIGLLCIQQKAIDRPNIAEVVSMITTSTDLPRPKQPAFALLIKEQESAVSVSESVNDITQTAMQGR